MTIVVKTECASCFVTVQIDFANAVAAAKVPSNGKRGSLHVPAHWKSTDFTFDGPYDAPGTLALWDCPVCGYADSTYVDPATRKELA